MDVDHDDQHAGRPAEQDAGQDAEQDAERSGQPLAAEGEKKARRKLSVWQETIVLLGAALALSFLVKTLFVQAFYIPSGSMEPGLVLNDRILVQKISYWGGGEPERGDVVVFEDPGGWLGAHDAAGPTSPVTKLLSKIGLYPTGGHLVKRVIGVGGDVIKCCDKRGRLLVNGEPLDSSGFTRNDEACDGPMPGCNWETEPVPDGYLFVMGDHRDASADSSEQMCRRNQTDCVPGREFVPVDNVVGKVFARVWPASRIQLLEKPDAFADLE